jgi:hypothetical protein
VLASCTVLMLLHGEESFEVSREGLKLPLNSLASHHELNS